MSIGKYSTTAPRLQAYDIPTAIVNYCGRGERNGQNWKCNCPICHRHALTITYGSKIPLLLRCWHCHNVGANDGYTEQRQIFIDAGIIPPDARTIKRFTPEERAAWRQAKREAAVRLWDRLVTISPDSNAAKYLHTRGLGSFVTHSALRHMGAIHPSGHPRLVLASRLWHVEHGISAVQFTYLNFDGSDRDRDLKPGRMTFGSMKGAAVWIGRPRADDEFVVAEGLESCLSAMLLLDIKCGAAVLGSHFKDLVLPSGVRKVHIAADNDETGRGAAAHSAKLWRQRGLKVRVSMPDIEGEDFNDVLKRKRALTASQQGGCHG